MGVYIDCATPPPSPYPLLVVVMNCASLHLYRRHESETHDLEKRWVEQISALKKSQERLELER